MIYEKKMIRTTKRSQEDVKIELKWSKPIRVGVEEMPPFFSKTFYGCGVNL